MPDHIRLIDVAGSFPLLLECGALPADAAVLAAGHEPNGYFWEGVLEYRRFRGGYARSRGVLTVH